MIFVNEGNLKGRNPTSQGDGEKICDENSSSVSTIHTCKIQNIQEAFQHVALSVDELCY